MSHLPRLHATVAILVPMSLGIARVAAGQARDSAPQHVDCRPLAPDGVPSAMGCTILGDRTLTHLAPGPAFWYLTAFPTRAAAEAAGGPDGVVADAEGRSWLFTIAPKGAGPRSGERVATVGPLPMPTRRPFILTAALAVLPAGSRSGVHTHNGPEAWYLLTGSQCLETPSGAHRTGPGETAIQRGFTPMLLSVTGKAVRHALLVVVHDSGTAFSAPSSWKPSGRCGEGGT